MKTKYLLTLAVFVLFYFQAIQGKNTATGELRLGIERTIALDTLPNPPYPNMPSPVTLVHFKAICLGNGKRMLSWTTASEKDSHFFTVEKSDDGYSWWAVGNVRASGTSESYKNYNLIDGESRLHHYYRLMQTDLDGSIQVFSVVLAEPCEEIDGWEVRVYPNPTADRIYIETNFDGAKNVLYELFSTAGNRLKADLMPANEPYSTDLSGYPPGIYIIRLWKDGIFATSIRAIKQ